MKFCSDCASPIAIKIPSDDTRERHVCTVCGTIHYQNPKLVVGTIPVWDLMGVMGETRVLLCKRAIEPRYGYWTLPAGFMENNETTTQGAQRETVEEAGANVSMHALFSMLNVPHVNQVHLFYRATLLDLDYLAGIESLDVQLFAEDEIPWNDIAFPTVRNTLKYFFADLMQVKAGAQFQLHTQDVHQPMRSA